MERIRLLSGVAALAFIVFLLAGVPATLLTSLAPGQVQLSNPAGSLWSGEASAIRVGTLRFGRTRWDLNPWRLLTGAVAGSVDASLPGGFARGDFVLGFGGRVQLYDFSAASPLANAAALFGTGLPLREGELIMEVTALDWSDGWVRRAEGELRIGQVPLVYRDSRAVPGQSSNFQLRFAAEAVPEEGPLEAELRDQGGPLAVVGTLRLSPPRNYELAGRASPREGAPAELSQALVMLGPETPEGGREFTFAGSF